MMIDILWTAYELTAAVFQGFAAVFQGFAAVYFVYEFLSRSGIKSFFRPRNFIFSTALSAMVFIKNILPEQSFGISYIFILIFIAFLILYGLISSKAGIFKKLFTAITAGVIGILSEAFGRGIAEIIIFGEKSEELMTHPCAERFIASPTSQMIILYLTVVLLRLFGNINTQNSDSLFEWGIVSAVLIISLIIGGYINFAINCAAAGSVEKLELFSMIVFMFIVIANILVCVMLFDLINKNKEINELKLSKQTREYNKQYIENLQAEYETARKQRHDFKNSFLLISTLLENGDADMAREQISKILGEISGTEIFINTENAIVNAVVNSKLSSAKVSGIECECFVEKEISGIDDVSLSRLLSNMLDNAIAACKNEPAGSRFLELSITANRAGYIFTVKNRISRSVLEANPSLKSTKENASEHGLGVGIIREIAGKYSGSSSFYEEDGMFCCRVRVRRGGGGGRDRMRMLN